MITYSRNSYSSYIPIMEMSDNSNQSLMYAMMKYDDTAITLADTRSQLKNSIVKHYVEIKKSELSNLKKLKFVEVDKTVPKMVVVSETRTGNQKEHMKHMECLKVEPNILEQNENLPNELAFICEMIQKLVKENEKNI